MRRIRFVDMLLVLIPGALCLWGAYGASNSDQADVRSSAPLLFLVAFSAYVAGYGIARMFSPRRPTRITILFWAVPLALITLFVGGMSLAVGYLIFAYVCAPIWGFVVSLIVQPSE